MSQPTRNEAGWGHTKRKRAAELAQVVERAKDVLLSDGAGDRVIGVLFVAVELVPNEGGKGHKPIAKQAAVAYGEMGLRALVEGADETLARVAATIQAGLDAKREAAVKGRKGRADA